MAKPTPQYTSCSNFSLEAFFPYQARIFYTHVTSSVSKVYEDLYGMTPAEWRVLAILGPGQQLTANEIAERSSIDKVAVSRAVQRLLDRAWLVSTSDLSDGRRKNLRLATTGTEVYFDLVARVLEVEQSLLAPLTPEEVRELDRLMRKVRTGALEP